MEVLRGRDTMGLPPRGSMDSGIGSEVGSPAFGSPNDPSDPAPSLVPSAWLPFHLMLRSVHAENSCGGGGGAGGAVVAIDNKIEQAMDLVKTHLMYAVREEIEALRGKIVDLEKKLGRVEAENRSLRAAASPEVLAQIEAQAAAAAASTATATPQPSTPATATAAAGGNPPLSAVSASQSQSQCPPTAPTQQPPPPASQAPQ